MSHGSIFSNLGAPILVLHRFIIRKPVHKFEICGLIAATIGSIVSVLDKDV